MQRTLLKSKIHRARITRKDLHYAGSVTIDRVLLQAADILPMEKVQVLNLENRERFETYVMEGTPDSGDICLNGPAARLGEPGDRLLIITYAGLDESELAGHRATVVHVDDANHITEVTSSPVVGGQAVEAQEEIFRA
jgi:aspartate 1-decarboxylase